MANENELVQPKHWLSVGEVAARCGVAVSALHFYEAERLIRSQRTRGNQRRYERDVLRRVSVIKVAQRVGIPLAEIRQALDTLPERRTPTAADWQAMSNAWRADLTERIVRLMRLRDQLGQCIGCGCLSIESCPLRNPNDVLAAHGPGPQLLEPCDLPDACKPPAALPDACKPPAAPAEACERGPSTPRPQAEGREGARRKKGFMK